MAILDLPLPPHIEARALLHHLLEHGDIVGEDATGRTIVQLALDHWALEKLMAFDAEVAELEDQGDDEPDVDDEVDGSPFCPSWRGPKLIRRSRATARSFGQVG